MLIISAGILAYSNSFGVPFIFDDYEAIRHNVYLRRLWPLSYSMNAPPESTVAGRPIVSLTLALNYALGGLHVFGYHVLNLTIHLLAGLVLFGIIRRTLQSSPRTASLAPSATGLAFAAALLWTVHPLQTESVTYVIQRAESLCGLFFLLTLYCALRGITGQRPLPWYVGAVVTCGLGMATKEVMVTAPLVVFAFDRIFFAESFQSQRRARGLFFLALGSTWFILIALIWGGPRSASAGFTVDSSTPWSYAATQFGVILYYLRLSLVPYPLCLDYAWPIADQPLAILGPGVVIVGLLAATTWALRRIPALGFLGIWFFIILSPTSTIVPIEDRAFEHRMYLPLAAICTLAVAAVSSILNRCPSEKPSPPRARAVGVALLTAITLAFVGLTLRRNYDYRTEESIWTDVVAKRPDNPRAYDALGMALMHLDRYDEAEAIYRQNIERWPDNSDSHHNLAAILAKRADYVGAAEEFRKCIEFAPGHPGGHYNLGLVLEELGNLDEAMQEYNEAIRLDPPYPEAHNSAGRLLMRRGRLVEAMEEFRQAVYYKPEWPLAHANLGNALAKAGQLDEAIRYLGEAIRLEPGSAEVHSNLGIALARLGRLDDAIAEFQMAINLKPGEPTPYYNLAQALVKKGNVDAALDQCRLIAKARPEDAEPLFFLGQLLMQSGRRMEAEEQFRAALKLDPNHRGAAARLAELSATPPSSTTVPTQEP